MSLVLLIVLWSLWRGGVEVVETYTLSKATDLHLGLRFVLYFFFNKLSYVFQWSGEVYVHPISSIIPAAGVYVGFFYNIFFTHTEFMMKALLALCSYLFLLAV